MCAKLVPVVVVLIDVGSVYTHIVFIDTDQRMNLKAFLRQFRNIPDSVTMTTLKEPVSTAFFLESFSPTFAYANIVFK